MDSEALLASWLNPRSSRSGDGCCVVGDGGLVAHDVEPEGTMLRALVIGDNFTMNKGSCLHGNCVVEDDVDRRYEADRVD